MTFGHTVRHSLVAAIAVATLGPLAACGVLDSDPGVKACYMIANHEIAKDTTGAVWTKVANLALESQYGGIRGLGQSMFAVVKDGYGETESTTYQQEQDLNGLEWGLEACENQGVTIPDDWAVKS